MTVPSQGGVFSYAVQPAKIGRGGTFTHTDLDWYRVRVPRVAFGTIQDQRPFPLETGGPLTPSGSYKQAVYPAGEVDMIPRIENAFGWLLLGAMGSVSSITGTDADGNAVSGVNTHIFRFNPSDHSYQPWMAVRRSVPGRTAGEIFGESAFDCKIGSLRFTIPQMGKVAARIVMVGRDIEYDDASTWVYANTLEATESTPDSGAGTFMIGGVEYPILGATVDVVTNLTSPSQEMVIGDFRPDDYIALTRGMQIRIVYKYENADLYRKLLTGQANGTEWSNLPFIVQTGAYHAFEARFQAPGNIAGTSTPFGLRIRANRVTWAVDGPIELNAGGFVTQSFVGTVEDPASGDYNQVVLENGETSYPMPT